MWSWALECGLKGERLPAGQRPESPQLTHCDRDRLWSLFPGGKVRRTCHLSWRPRGDQRDGVSLCPQRLRGRPPCLHLQRPARPRPASTPRVGIPGPCCLSLTCPGFFSLPPPQGLVLHPSTPFLISSVSRPAFSLPPGCGRVCRELEGSPQHPGTKRLLCLHLR